MKAIKKSALHRTLVALLTVVTVFPFQALLTPSAFASDGSGSPPSPSPGNDKCSNPPVGCITCPCPPEGGMSAGTASTASTAGPVQFMLNSAMESVVDLQIPGPGLSWSHSRTYDSRMARNTADLEGVRWHGGGTAQFFVASGSDLVLYFSASSKREFKYVDGTTYTAPVDSPLTLIKSGTGVSEILTVTNIETGGISVYYGFSTTISAENRGRIKERTSRVYQAAGKTGNTYQYNANGMVAWVMSSRGSLVEYEYYPTPTGNGLDDFRLKSISVYAGAINTSTLLQRAEYMYYDTVTNSAGTLVTADTGLGLSGDLVQVKIRKRASTDIGTTLSIVRITQYRYFKQDNSHQLKAVFESDAIQRILDYDPNDSLNNPEDLLTLADSTVINATLTLIGFASRAFTHYDTSRLATNAEITTKWGLETLSGASGKYGGDEYSEWDIAGFTLLDFWDGVVKSETFGGGCSSCGTGVEVGVSKEYYYVELADWYGYVGKDSPNQVVRLVIEDTIDSAGTARSRRIYGVNYKGAVIREAFLEDPINPNANNIWCTSIILNSDWRVTQRRTTSAHKDQVVDDATLQKFLNPTNSTSTLGTNDSDTVNAGSGLVYHTEYSGAPGKMPTGQLVSIGTTGLKYYVSATDYGDGDNDGVGQDKAEGKLPVARYVYPSQTLPANRSTGKVTTLTYEFWDTNDTAVKKITTTQPALGSGTSGQNGSGVATTTKRYFDKLGRLRWTVDGAGYVSYFSYHPDTGGLAFKALDVDPGSMPANATGNDTLWVSADDNGTGPNTYVTADKPTRGSSLPTALDLVSTSEFDDQGRVVKSTGPTNGTGGAEHRTLYFADGTIRLPYVDGTGNPQLPAQVAKINGAGVLLETYSVDPATVSTSTTALPTAGLVSRTVYNYDPVNGKRTQVDRYHDINGTAGEGTNKQYYGTRFLYDVLGRQGATVRYAEDGKFQVTANLFDVRDRVIETRRGVATIAPTDYSTLDVEPIGTPTGFPANGYVTVRKTVYDSGSVGDGYVTKTKRYYDTGKYTGQIFHRTYRGHLRGIEPIYDKGAGEKNNLGPYQAIDVDWQGRTVATAQYTTVPTTWPTDYVDYVYNFGATPPAPKTAGHNNLAVTHYDDLGRVYRTLRYPGTETTNRVEVNNYYDRNGRLACTGDKYSIHTEYAYDGAGRQYQTRTVKDISAATPFGAGGDFTYNAPLPKPDFASMSGGGTGGLIELSHTAFDAGGNVTEQHSVELNHDDTNGFSLATGQPTGGVRRSLHSWYDAADRLITTANFGSGAATWQSSVLPTRPTGNSTTFTSDANRLITQYVYDAATGRQNLVKGPNHTVAVPSQTKTFYDDLGRRIAVAENWADFAPPTTGIGDATDKSKDRVTAWMYNGLGQTAKLTAYNGGSAAAQNTNYYYEDPVNASLVTHTVYPDSTATPTAGTDLVKTTYNLDGSRATMTDQRGTEHTYVYNNRRQLLDDDVTTLGSAGHNVDGAVRSLGRTYDPLGRLTQITSYDGISTGAQIPLNEVKLSYDARGQVSKSEQNHASAVGAGTPAVQYAYDADITAGFYSDGLRLKNTTYPSGRVVHNTFGVADSIADRLGRAAEINQDASGSPGVALASYQYNGTSRVAQVKYDQASVERKMFSSAGNYDSWDRFGRTKTHAWKTTGAVVRDQVNHTYDYAGNRLTRDVTAATYDTRDQVYAYDGLLRLIDYNGGTLVGSSISGTPKHEQVWSLDQLGNWGVLTVKVDGVPVLGQNRSHNDANEIDNDNDHTNGNFGISGFIGQSWADPAYDAAGNMTTIPKPSVPTSTYTLKYDAWNRLVEVKEGTTTVQTNQYDGLNRRIQKVAGADTFDYYYNQQWQVLEERKGGSANPLSQYVYHPNYVDAVALRDYDSDTNGSSVRHYYLQDANFNVTAVVDSTGAVVERYSYTPYGEVALLAADFSPLASSTISNELLYTGRRRDPETGLQLNRNRFYALHLGRWVNRDLIGYAGGTLNLYEYVGGRPLIYLDSMGLGCVEMFRMPSKWSVIPFIPPTPKRKRSKGIITSRPVSKVDCKFIRTVTIVEKCTTHYGLCYLWSGSEIRSRKIIQHKIKRCVNLPNFTNTIGANPGGASIESVDPSDMEWVAKKCGSPPPGKWSDGIGIWD